MAELPQEEDVGGNGGFKNEQLQLNEPYDAYTAATGGANGGGDAGNGGKSSSPFPRVSVPPFLTKVYEMVNDLKTNEIISWSSGGTCFTVWDHHVFSKEILPKYFRHDNFSSFVYQLNNYGFNKISWGQWEYENKWFQRGKDYLLVNIKRKNQNRLVAKKNREMKPCINSGNLVLEAHLEKQRADHNKLKLEIQELLKKQENMDNALVTIKEQIHSLFKEQKMMVSMASALSPKHSKKLQQQTKQDHEHDEAEILEKEKVLPESVENPMELIDGRDTCCMSLMENNHVQPEKDTMSCDDSGNLAQNQTVNAASEAYVPDTNFKNCLLLEDLMCVDGNEQKGETGKQEANVNAMELENLLGTPAEWGYMREFMYQVDLQETKTVIPMEGEGKAV